jgi:Family of unknown function (DUF6445)
VIARGVEPREGTRLPGGRMLVVDDFYEDPERVREVALRSEYRDPIGSWNGLHSAERAPDTRETLFRIAALVSDSAPNWEEIEASYQFWHRVACGGFATLFEGEHGIVHSHRRSGDFAGVVYMSRPEDCAGRDGTLFYRHGESGLEAFEGDEDDPRFVAAKADAADLSKWEVTAASEMVFNRLIVFDSRYFHAPSHGFGKSIEDGRLTQVFNFTFVD